MTTTIDDVRNEPHMSTVRRTPRLSRVAETRRRATLPPWPADAWKGNCRPLSHAAAVRECAFLSEEYRRIWRGRTNVVIELDKIVRTLRAKRVPFVLTGAYGISSWTGRPRATHDIDLLIRSGRNHARAVNALHELYPELEVRRFPILTAFFVAGETQSVIDVAIPYRGDQKVALETGIWVEEQGLRYRIPTLETALASKYGKMLDPMRDAGNRAQDAIDFGTMVKHSLDEGRAPINLAKLRDLGEMVCPGGGGDEVLRLVDDAKAGNIPNLFLSASRPRGPATNGGG
jgi:hypothetical protein